MSRRPAIRFSDNTFPFVLLFLLLLSLAVRLPILHAPLDRDEGGFAYSGWIWNQGELPYRDAFDNKPPLFHFIYRASIRLIGATQEAVHGAVIACGLLAVLLFYRLSRRWLSPASSTAASLFFSLLAAEPTFAVGTAGNPGLFALPPILAAAIALPSSPFLAGCCIGAAALIRQSAVFYAVAFGLFILLSDTFGKTESAGRAGALARYAAGALFMPLGWALYFLVRRAWAPMWEAVVTYNLHHTTSVFSHGLAREGIKDLWINTRALAQPEAAIWLLAAAGLAILFFRRTSFRLLFFLWLGASLLSFCLSFRFLSHYFVELSAILALLAGFALGEAERFWPHRRSLVPLLTSLGVLAFLWSNRAFLTGRSPENFMREAYAGNSFPEAAAVGRFIGETTTPQDRIFVFGSEPEIYFYAQRKNVSRQIFFYPLTSESSRALAYQRETADAVERQWPQVLVWVNNPLSFLAGPKTPQEILRRGSGWLHSGRYRLDGAVFAERNGPSRFFFGPERIRQIDPASLPQAAYLLYRLEKPELLRGASS